MIRVDGDVRRINLPAMEHKEVHALVYEVMNDKQRKDYEELLETDFSFEVPGLARFRVNAFNQNRGAGAVFRTIPSKVLTMEQLGLGNTFKNICMQPNGMVLVTGPTGSGKSTTLAAMIDYINENKYEHILTVEDPIEFVHSHKGCLISQREVGIDTESYEVALANTLRQAPDVIMIGEVRTAKTMQAAMAFAETGHLCLCTLHANNANQALDRIQSFFPSDQLNQVWMDLSLNLKAMVAQQLVPGRMGNARVPIVEVLLGSPLILDHVRKGEVHLIKELMSRSTDIGMQTFDQSLISTYKAGLITSEEAERHADSANDVRLEIKLFEKGSGALRDSRNFNFDLED